MNNYCENEKQIREFVLRRSNEGTVWECDTCHFRIRDIAKYKDNYNSLPVPDPQPKQPKIL